MATADERPATPEDDEFLYQLYASTRTAEMSLLGWQGSQMEQFLRMQLRMRTQSYAAQYPGAAHSIFLHDDKPIGAAIVHRSGAEICLLDIAILPEFQGRGLGAAWISSLIAEATAASAPLRLHVLNGNRAVSLYSKLGFRQVSDDGMYIGMEFSNKSA